MNQKYKSHTIGSIEYELHANFQYSSVSCIRISAKGETSGIIDRHAARIRSAGEFYVQLTLF